MFWLYKIVRTKKNTYQMCLFVAGDWSIAITPGKEAHMGTTNNLFLVVYGKMGKSNILPLQNTEINPAVTSEYIVSLLSLLI